MKHDKKTLFIAFVISFICWIMIPVSSSWGNYLFDGPEPEEHNITPPTSSSSEPKSVVPLLVISIIAIFVIIAQFVIILNLWKKKGIKTNKDERMFCTVCGTKIDEGSRFCIKCGSPVR